MANIQKYLDDIKKALFGREVRGSIHDAIEAINKETERTTASQEHLDSTFKQLIINAGQSNAEVVDARVEADGTTHATLGDRLDNLDSKFGITNKEVVDARTDKNGIAHKDLKTRLDNVDSQLEHNTSELEIIRNRNDYIYLEEEYYNTNDYDKAFENCLNKLKGQGGGVLILPNKTINLNEGLIIDSNIQIKGSYKTKLYFNASSNSNCIQLVNCKCILENFEIAGAKTLTGLSLVNTIDKPVVDSIFRNLRISDLTTGIKSEYAWDISFYDTRVHNCTTVAIFGNQSNQIAFNSCKFSSFTQGFSFTNCEIITFRNCDFVNGTTLIYNQFQSFVSMYEPYIEHIPEKFIFGHYNEAVASTLHLEGGLVTGTDKTMNICIQNKVPSSVSINNVLYTGFYVFLKNNTHLGQLSQFKLNNIRGAFVCEPIKTYKGDSDITSVYSKIYGGNQLITEVNDTFATVKPDPWNGIIISNSLKIGETYTVVVDARSTNSFCISQSQQQQIKLVINNDGFKRLILPFVALSNTVQLYECEGISDTSIDIKEISIYKGIYSE